MGGRGWQGVAGKETVVLRRIESILKQGAEEGHKEEAGRSAVEPQGEEQADQAGAGGSAGSASKQGHAEGERARWRRGSS